MIPSKGGNSSNKIRARLAEHKKQGRTALPPKPNCEKPAEHLLVVATKAARLIRKIMSHDGLLKRYRTAGMSHGCV